MQTQWDRTLKEDLTDQEIKWRPRIYDSWCESGLWMNLISARSASMRAETMKRKISRLCASKIVQNTWLHSRCAFNSSALRPGAVLSVWTSRQCLWRRTVGKKFGLQKSKETRVSQDFDLTWQVDAKLHTLRDTASCMDPGRSSESLSLWWEPGRRKMIRRIEQKKDELSNWMKPERASRKRRTNQGGSSRCWMLGCVENRGVFWWGSSWLKGWRSFGGAHFTVWERNQGSTLLEWTGLSLWPRMGPTHYITHRGGPWERCLWFRM